MATSSGTQGERFVPIRNRQLDVPASELTFTLGFESSTVHVEFHHVTHLALSHDRH